MFNIQPMTTLYTEAQGYFSRAQRAWEAALEAGRAAWDEDTDATILSIPSSEIIISNRLEAIERALCASAEPISASRLVLWTDASVTRIGAGWAVAFWDGLNWVRITARGPTVRGPKRRFDSNIAEVQAISLAFDYAVQFVERKTKDETPLQILEVYTDCQAALKLLQVAMRDLSSALDPANLPKKSIQSGMIVRDTILKIETLQEAGVNIELHWVPRNTTYGNFLADEGAGLARMDNDGYYTLNNALLEFMPSRTDKIQEKSKGLLPLAYTYDIMPQTYMAKQIALILGKRKIKPMGDESRKDSPEGSQEESQDESMEDTPGQSLEDSPEKRLEESQDTNLNLDLLYDAPVVLVDMKEVIPIDPDLWQLYGESL